MDDTKIKSHLLNFFSQINKDRNPYTSSINHRDIPRQIRHRWEIWGQNVELMELTHYNHKGANLWIPPKDPSKKCVLLLAHHDTVPNCPGIDDNGSGMAVLDFLAYYFSILHPSINIAFAMVDWEESDPRIWKHFEDWAITEDIKWSDMTVISKEKHYNFRNYLHKHVSDVGSFIGTRKLFLLLQERNIEIDVVLNLETVGFVSDIQKMPEGTDIHPEKGDFIALIGNMLSEYWIERLMKTASHGFYLPMLVPMNGKSMPDTRRSDHSVFWDENIPAIMLTDTANFRNPHYHLPSDTEIDYDFMVKLIKSLIKLIE